MEVKVLNVEYKKPEVSVRQTDWNEVRRYLKQGYYITKRENGQCYLSKSSKIFVTFECEGKERKVDFKRSLEKFYGHRGGYVLTKLFKKDLEKGSITITIDSRGYYRINKA